jgi:hypothetical protein
LSALEFLSVFSLIEQTLHLLGLRVNKNDPAGTCKKTQLTGHCHRVLKFNKVAIPADISVERGYRMPEVICGGSARTIS